MSVEALMQRREKLRLLYYLALVWLLAMIFLYGTYASGNPDLEFLSVVGMLGAVLLWGYAVLRLRADAKTILTKS